MNITLLNFSPRTTGNCAAICRQIQNYYANTNIRLFDVCKYISPCSSCDYECLTPGVECPMLTEGQHDLMDAIRTSDLVYYVVPNFCGMPNSVYYAFNERSVGYFNMDRGILGQYMAARKRFIVVSNTESNIFVEALRQQTRTDPEILYLKTGKYKKKSTAGDMMDSEEARSDLLDFLKKDDHGYTSDRWRP